MEVGRENQSPTRQFRRIAQFLSLARLEVAQTAPQGLVPGLVPVDRMFVNQPESPHYDVRHGRAQSSNAAGWAMFLATQNSAPRRQARQAPGGAGGSLAVFWLINTLQPGQARL
jgi:hypothetical protein